jgi:dihydrofolate synthase/folylpolyglutamate synthase
MKTLADASNYLEGLIDHERRPGFSYVRLDLRPIRALLEGLDRPEKSLSIIHVAGSKGKGSTCLFAESILLSLGERVGTFTSPHLESWVERFRINGCPVSSQRLVAAVRQVRPVVEDLRSGPPETLPSFFDATTAVALLLFAEARVDRALIEVGLGGRLDSTNVVHPAVTCVTSIELEHTDKLGETEIEIAGEKAGILKPEIPVVIGALRPDAARVVRARAKEVGAAVMACDEHFTIESSGSQPGGVGANAFRFRADEGSNRAFEVDVALRVPGRAAIENAALAIVCVRALGVHSDDALRGAIGDGLARCALPARIEVLENDSRVIVDGAHTAESARVLANALETLAPKGYELLLSISSDKNLDALLEALLPRTRRVWVTRADPLRSVAVDELAIRVRAQAPTITVEVVEDPELAARRARAELSSTLRLCVAGSIYLAGVVRRVLGDDQPDREKFSIGLARPGDAEALPGIEERAASLFSPDDVSPGLAAKSTAVGVYQKAQEDGRVLVARDTRDAGDRVVGFVHLTWIDEHVHLEEVDVEPEFGRRGLGRRLTLAACDWAREQGSDQITLATFRDVPWNAPFYARLGFESIPELELSPALQQLRAHEVRSGLDPGKRVMMSRRLPAARKNRAG